MQVEICNPFDFQHGVIRRARTPSNMEIIRFQIEIFKILKNIRYVLLDILLLESTLPSLSRRTATFIIILIVAAVVEQIRSLGVAI